MNTLPAGADMDLHWAVDKYVFFHLPNMFSMLLCVCVCPCLLVSHHILLKIRPVLDHINKKNNMFVAFCYCRPCDSKL